MKNFLAYIPAGFPNLETTASILKEVKSLPITGVEVGIPFSDPVADGPVIQEAHTIALENKTNLSKILRLLENLNLPYEVYLMSYLNPLIHFPEGTKKLAQRLKRAKVKGLIIPDLPLKEIKNIELNYPFVLFTAPNTSYEEIAIINKVSPPFVYYVARYGVTGAKKDIPFVNHIKALKKRLNIPFYVGFGISTPQQVKKVWDVADGAIVGSALVKEMAKGSPERIAQRVCRKIKYLLHG